MTPNLDTTDALGRRVALTALPRRVVSLVPSQTALLADLGLDVEATRRPSPQPDPAHA